MAIEVLIKRLNRTEPGVADGYYCQRGDVLAVKASPAGWGRREDPSHADWDGQCWIITIEGIDITDPIVDTLLAPGDTTGEGVEAEPVTQRAWYLNVDGIPSAYLTQLEATGRLTITTGGVQLVNNALTAR